MPECPHCKQIIDTKDLRDQFSIKSYRTCPSCKQLFTVDASTKRRQATALAMALIALILTLALLFKGPELLIPSILTYIVLGLFIYWGNKRVVFIPYEKSQGDCSGL